MPMWDDPELIARTILEGTEIRAEGASMITFADLTPRLALPVIAAPMFLVSGPELVTAACLAGVDRSLPHRQRPHPGGA